MTSNQISPVIPKKQSRRAIGIDFPEAQKVMTLGRENGWGFATLGQAPMPEEPGRLGRWLIVPAEQDNTPMPTRSLERIQALFAAGIRPKGFVVVHEAPALLPEKVGEIQEEIKISTWPPSIRRRVKRTAAILGFGVIGLLVLPAVVAIMFAVLTAVAIIAVPLLLVTGLVALDPILVVVTEDDVWIEIDRWWVE